ncbi:MAG: ATP-binding protein, partial [Methylococcaceae bacterium]|nr:ATP-binding protein [Methylococcaceae bacterium]
LHVYLHDGSTLIMQTDLKHDDEEGSSVLLHLVIILITIMGFSYVAVRWVTRPLQQLASAAEDLGRDIHRPPLDESGPIEVSRAAHAFNTMQDRLIRHIQDRAQLLAAISHDLKTPITRLRLRTELLDDGDIRARFQKDLDEMETMVMATLDFMRGVGQQEAFQLVDMMALLESIQADAQEMNANVNIYGTVLSPYPGKPSALKRCINNLIDNALKYGRCATLFVEDSDDCCIIRILDKGPGIPKDQLKTVFTPYYRLESSRNRDSGGTGLGLSIAQDIAEAHGGHLVLYNTAEGGLEVVLTLPRTHKSL